MPKGFGIAKVHQTQQVFTNEGDNAKMIANALRGWDQVPVDIDNPEEINNRLFEYLTDCCNTDTRPSVSGASLWLGCDERYLSDWQLGLSGTVKHQEVAVRFYSVIKTLWNEYMQNGKINPVAGIYMSKVYFGYKETQEINVITKRGIEMSAADLIAQAKLLPGADALSLPEGDVSIVDE